MKKKNPSSVDFESRSCENNETVILKASISNSYLHGKLFGACCHRRTNVCSFFLGNYSGNVFGIAKTSWYLSIRKLALKNKPTVRTIQCSEKWNSPIFIHTLMNVYPSFIPGYSRLLVIYTCTKPREETAGKWPLLFTSVSAPKLTSGGTLRSTDMETNKCFYLRAPIMRLIHRLTARQVGFGRVMDLPAFSHVFLMATSPPLPTNSISRKAAFI